MGQSQAKVCENMKINKDTNTDTLTRQELIAEAKTSTNRARVQLLQHIHIELEQQESMETAYGYNPLNDMSFTGEFEAIGS